MPPKSNHKILIIDDDEVDRMMLERAFRRADPGLQLSKAVNGQDALDMLESKACPDLIILDIRMPVLDGRETLCKIKNDGAWKHIPVIMNSTSADTNDIDFCYQNHANGFIVKPNSLAESDSVVGRLVDFWIKTCALPQPIAL